MNNHIPSSPKIWGVIPAKAVYLSGQGDCGDCDCDCSDCVCDACSDSTWRQTPLNRFASQQDRMCYPRDIRVNTHPETYFQTLGEYQVALGLTAACPLVLDPTSALLLRDALQPISLEELRRQAPDWSQSSFDQVIALLFSQGLLLTPQAAASVVPETSPTVLSAWLTLTHLCTLNCRYCYVPRSVGPLSQPHMQPATAKRIVQAVFRSAGQHGFRKVKLKYSGGEPTLNFGALQIAQASAEHLAVETGLELESVLLTNGMAISPGQLDYLTAHSIRIMISLDGLGDSQDTNRPQADGGVISASRVLKTLDTLLERGLSPHISITITRPSLPHVPALVTYLLERSLRFSLNFYRPPGASRLEDPLVCQPEELIAGMQQIYTAIEAHLPPYSLYASLADRANPAMPHRRTCGAGESYLVVDTHGNISACQMELANPSTHIADNDPLGTLRKNRAGLQNLPVDQKDCALCRWRYRCVGGCPRLARQAGGSYSSRSPLCTVYQAILPATIRLEALRLLRFEQPWTAPAV